MENHSGHRLLTLTDVEEAARVIASAFVDDPLCAFMLPIKRTREKTLYRFFRAYGELNIKSQRGYGYGEPLSGVAYWQFPGQSEISIGVRSLSIFLPLLFSFYLIGFFRARGVLQQIDQLHQKHAPGPHFYLDNLGVLSSARGQGVSSRLVRPFLEMADSERFPVYTDTVNRENVGLYEHFGFRCVEELPIPGTGITVFALSKPVEL
jgi:ribosomal protein S18 acetylase RimI-like enzyme